jgi:hypothetical protein
MALVLPSPAQLQAYRDGVSDAEALQRAADLFTIATGVSETPVEVVEARMVQTAILDMAWYLQTAHEDREAEFSPFSSERIGSYSYSKMQKAAQEQKSTGVAAFDAAVAYFTEQNRLAIFGTTSEWVFQPGEQFGPSRGADAGVDWDRPTPYTVEGGRIVLDETGQPVLEVD